MGGWKDNNSLVRFNDECLFEEYRKIFAILFAAFRPWLLRASAMIVVYNLQDQASSVATRKNQKTAQIDKNRPIPNLRKMHRDRSQTLVRGPDAHKKEEEEEKTTTTNKTKQNKNKQKTKNKNKAKIMGQPRGWHSTSFFFFFFQAVCGPDFWSVGFVKIILTQFSQENMWPFFQGFVIPLWGSKLLRGAFLNQPP